LLCAAIAAVVCLHTLRVPDVWLFTLPDTFRAGNIAFEQGKDSESSRVSAKSTETLTHCAELLGVNTEMFTYSLTEKKVQMGRGSIVSIALNVSQAEDNRDTVAKTLYSNMFDWTIVKVSSCVLHRVGHCVRMWCLWCCVRNRSVQGSGLAVRTYWVALTTVSRAQCAHP
jgi:hypothetical protein